MTGSSRRTSCRRCCSRPGRIPGLGERDDGAARAWLFTASRNLIIDRWRSAANRHELATEEPVERQTADATSVVLDRWLIAEALSGLSIEHRTVISAAYYEGRSVADISARLRIPGGHGEVAVALRVADVEVDLAGEGGDPAVTAPIDRYGSWDAAYVLGALSPAERREFEEHLAGCPGCQAAVSELAGLPGLLAQVSPEDAALLAATPDRARRRAAARTAVAR